MQWLEGVLNIHSTLEFARRPKTEKGGHFPVHRCRSAPQGGVSRDERRFERIFPRPSVFHHRRKNGLRYLAASDLIKIKELSLQESTGSAALGPFSFDGGPSSSLLHPEVLSRGLQFRPPCMSCVSSSVVINLVLFYLIIFPGRCVSL